MLKEIPTEKSAREKLVSHYNPSQEERAVTAAVLNEYQRSKNIMENPRNEFDGRNVLQETIINQKAFNSYVPPLSQDPDEDWRAQTVRPITRNKIISIAAHVTAKILYPRFAAQNSQDEDDKAAGMVMTDLVEWVIDNSNYKRKFIQGVISALTSPAMVVEAGFFEVMRKIKEIKADGTWDSKEVLDMILSGFIFNVVPVSELYIANIKEENIQKQRYVMRRRYRDFLETKQVYKDSPNIDSVKQGVMTVFSEDDDLFYEMADDEAKDHLVYEVRYYNRSEDLELVFLNGILVTEPDQPNRRKDKLYPFAKSIHEPINDGVFFYGKSAASKLSSDQEVIDTLYNMVLDGSFLQLMPPLAHYGSEAIDSSVTVPGMITSFQDPNSKLESILPRSDTRGGMEAISLVEKSMAESSQDAFRSGIAQGGERTAREVMTMTQNAQIQLGLFGHQIGFMVEDLGELIKGDILQHMTVGQVDEITNGINFRKFILRDKIENGKKVTKEISFSMDQFAETKDPLEESFKLLEQEGGMNKKKSIVKVNPSVFRDLKFMTSVVVDELTPSSKALEKALALEAYDRGIQNPVADQEAVTRDFLFDVYKPGEADKYIKEKPEPVPGGQEQKNVNSNLTGQLTGSNSLGVAAST